ncbi:MAG: hypothetical protein RR614_02505, partial [Eubacterium sp.]
MKKQRIFILCLSMVLIAGLLAPTALAKSSSWVPEITGEGTKTESSWSDQGTEMLPGEDQKPSDFLQTVDGPVIETQPVDAHYDVPNSTKIFVEVAQEDEGKCDFQWQWENNGKWFNFIGADAKKASLDIPATTRTLNETNVRCVITYSKQADKITISDSAQFIMDSEQDTYAIVGHQGLTTGNTIKLTDGGSASLSADGKKLTLKDATINLQEHLMLPSGSTGLQYYVTPEKENDVASIEYSGNNTIYMDNEHSSPDLDGIKKGFANIAFTQMVSDFSNKRMTLNIGGTGTLNLETDAIQKGLFQFYGIYAEAFINIQDYSNINIINPSVGIRTADLTIGKGAEMNIFSENQSILINPSYNAPGD